MGKPDPLPTSATTEVVPGEKLLALLLRARGKGLTAKELFASFTLERDARQALLTLLDDLVAIGLLVQRGDHRYSVPTLKVRLVIGTLMRQRGGHGLVVTDKKEEVFIPPRSLGNALDGDRVVVGVDRKPGRLDQRPLGRQLYVLHHAHREVLGRLVISAQNSWLVPLFPRFAPSVLIPPASAGLLRSGQIAIAQIDAWRGREQAPVGTIVTILGEASDPAIDYLTVAYKYALSTVFPEKVLSVANQLNTPVASADCSGRVDLRHLPMVTIDGEDARDFDDAVCVREEGEGQTRLWVAIADVSMYVMAGGDIDQEALQRGTSVYFPGRCLPMLPEPLSNGICSLQPGLDRLVLVAELLFSATGARIEQRFYPAVICSRARLTYAQVQNWLVRGAAVADPLALVPQILVMGQLAASLTAMRMTRGSLDFDVPEAEIVFDDLGHPVQVLRRARTEAHRLIEEFMLAANEAVADHLASHGLPVLYRVHAPPEPERLATVQEFAAHFNQGLVVSDDPLQLARALQKLLSETEGSVEARAIHQMLLRSMQQAFYAPVNIGHFGLAAKRYCHFTSPIRRYPDLVIHRLLRLLWQDDGQKAREMWRMNLPALGERLSALERRAMDAERDMLALCKCRFMSDKVGKEYVGMVASVQPFGLFVELKEFFVEGLLGMSGLGDDYYEFDPEQMRLVGQRRRRIFQVGDVLLVKVARVDADAREVDFVLAESREEFRVESAPWMTGRLRRRGRR